jgi:transposase-like protein
MSHGKSDQLPDPEVVEKAQRRRFSAAYKLQILGEVDRCAEPGEIGSLLRREGLYSSLLSTWRRQRSAGSLEALSTKKRGRKPRVADPSADRIVQLERKVAQLSCKLQQAEAIIEVQKKLSEILGIELPDPAEGGGRS